MSTMSVEEALINIGYTYAKELGACDFVISVSPVVYERLRMNLGSQCQIKKGKIILIGPAGRIKVKIKWPKELK